MHNSKNMFEKLYTLLCMLIFKIQNQSKFKKYARNTNVKKLELGE